MLTSPGHVADIHWLLILNKVTMANTRLSQLRQDALRVDLPRVADLLLHRRASEIDDTSIDDMVSLFWLEWLGGSLQLTITGSNICRQQLSRPAN